MNYIKRFSFVNYKKEGVAYKGIINGSYNDLCGFPFYHLKERLNEKQMDIWKDSHNSYMVYIIEGKAVVSHIAWVDVKDITVTEYNPEKALAMVQLYEVGE